MARELVSWIGPDSVVTLLTNGATVDILRDRQGAWAPGFSFIEDEVPLQAGARWRATKTLPREVSFTLFVQAADAVALAVFRRALMRTFDPTAATPGRLRVTTVDSLTRDLYCRYASGLAGEESPARMGPGGNWAEFPLVFRAMDPYWYDASIIELVYSASTSLFTFFPIPPVRVNPDTIIGNSTVQNPGDVRAWPIWTVQGPGTSLRLENLTTGESLFLTRTLTSADILVIDTRPGYKTVTLLDGTSLYATLDATSVLWALAPGANDIRITLASSTSVSVVRLSAQPRYFGL